MKLLVTGAGGFVAGQLAADFRAKGHEVTALDRRFDAFSRRRLGGCALLEQDAADVRALPEVDVLIHGAAVTAAPEEYGLPAALLLEEAVATTLKLLSHCCQTRTRFVLLSSAGVFAADVPGPLTESSLPTATNPYAAAKRASELAALSLREHAGLDSVSVRLGNLYGPGERTRPSRPRISLLQRMLDEGRASGRITVKQPAQRREWTNLCDLAPALECLLSVQPFPQPLVHLCAPEVRSELELAQALAAPLPGCRVVLEPEAPEAIRPPFRSALMTDFPWTGLEQGLDALLAHALLTQPLLAQRAELCA